MRIQRPGACVLAAICGLLSACIALPVPEYEFPSQKPEFRSTIDERPPSRIVAGRTTRTEVLLLLGEPDGRGVRDEWLTWGSVARRGGVRTGVLVAGVSPSGGGSEAFGPFGNRQDNARRLLIRFSDRGVVASAEVQFSTCDEGKWVMAPGESGCLHPSGPDLR